jgi:probable blue pigment (indigoidine) exporter
MVLGAARDSALSQSSRLGLMLVVTAPAAICYPAIKAGLAFAPPLRFAGLRTLIAGVVLIALLCVLKKPLWPTPTLAWWILPIGLIGTTMTFGTMFMSPAFTGAGIASVLGNAQPLMVMLLAGIFLGEHITSGKVLALGLGLTGIILLSLPSLKNQDQNALQGGVLALGSSASAAVASVILKKLRPGRHLAALTGWQLIIGSLPLLALSLFYEAGQRISWESSFFGLLLFLALAGTALTTLLWFWLLQKSEAGSLSLYLFLVPIFGLLIAYAVYGETLERVQVIGVLLILAGIGFSTSKGSFHRAFDGKKTDFAPNSGDSPGDAETRHN